MVLMYHLNLVPRGEVIGLIVVVVVVVAAAAALPVLGFGIVLR